MLRWHQNLRVQQQIVPRYVGLLCNYQNLKPGLLQHAACPQYADISSRQLGDFHSCKSLFSRLQQGGAGGWKTVKDSRIQPATADLTMGNHAGKEGHGTAGKAAVLRLQPLQSGSVARSSFQRPLISQMTVCLPKFTWSTWFQRKALMWHF